MIGGVSTPVNVNGRAAMVKIDDKSARSLDSAFSLLEHNGPFIERARKFQDELSYDGKTWRGLITNYLELGPFQARARVSNTAVPYVRDLHLRLNFDTNPSKFDSTVGSEMTGLPLSSCRTVPAKLFEFGTIANMLHPGESVRRYGDFICGMKLKYTEKPYLEVQYVRYIEPMKSFYNLRCFEHQYEQSNPFELKPGANTRVSPVSTQRVTSRLLSYPTKIYLYASFADSDQHPYGLGNVRRSCLLNNLHCRVNQRPDIIFNPSQEECYQMFRRHTNSSLEYGSWLKAPIYVFDPVDLAQPDFLANDARLTLMEWDAEVSLTALQMQEISDLKSKEAILNEGYNRKQFDTADFLLNPVTSFSVEFYGAGGHAGDYDPGEREYDLILQAEQGVNSQQWPFLDADAQLILNNHFQFAHRGTNFQGVYPSPTTEIITCTTVGDVGHIVRGFIWACVNMTNGAVRNNQLFYLPMSHNFTGIVGRPNILNRWDQLLTTVVNAGQPNETYTFAVNQATIKTFVGEVQGGALDSYTINSATNPSRYMTPGVNAWRTDRKGITNQNVADNLPVPAGELQASVNYPVIDQTVNLNLRWVCFRPSDAMYNGSDVDAKVIRWKTDRPLFHQKANGLTETDQGNPCLRVEGTVARNQILTRTLPPHPDLVYDANTVTSFPLQHVTLHTNETHAFDYTLKALYEYGNSQYQFTSDGAPTKVLPNLVPVRDSSAIPIV